MKIFIVGGTGFLGYYATLEFLRKGHSVSTISLPDIPLGDWFPKEVGVEYGNVFEMSHEELVKLFSGYDGMVYAVGPDDRYTPNAPAYDFFHERLVVACTKVVEAARDAGVKTCTVCNSYFATFDRLHPEWELAKNHPYIRCRVEQAKSVIDAGADKMKVTVLELPYIFGTMPERVPLWRDILLERLKKMPIVMFPKGGTVMMTVEQVAESIVGAIENGSHGKRYPCGDENIEWKTMLRIMLDAMGLEKRKIMYVPTWITTMVGKRLRAKDAKEGKEAGLNHARLFKDIQARFLYYDPTPTNEELGVTRGGVAESITKTVKRCYPDQ